MPVLNYLLKDHASALLSTGLGSWNTLTDDGGNKLQEINFDACSVKLGFCEGNETKALVERIPARARGREGNRHDLITWRAFTSTPPTPLFDRGFTGHSLSREERNGKHLYGLGLINMNGRMGVFPERHSLFGNPVVSRMLSPDNFVQAPGNPQNYIRYTYALNNPLKYTDHEG